MLKINILSAALSEFSFKLDNFAVSSKQVVVKNDTDPCKS